MIGQVEITYENRIIRIKWEWNDSDAESVDIRYGKKEAVQMAEFQSGILRNTQDKFGYAEKKTAGERGLYTFLLIVYGNAGKIEEIKVENIALGEPIQVLWKIERGKDGCKITFPKCDAVIPAHVLLARYGKIEMEIGYEVSREAELLIWEKLETEPFQLCVKEPYDKVIRLKQD